MEFLFWLFLVGIVVGSLQDLARREVDNWLNFFLLASGAGYLVFASIFEMSWSFVLLGLMSFVIMVLLGNLFYYGRVFAGGDAKLLIAMFALFVGATWIVTLVNIGMFVLFLMLAGSLYGFAWGFGLYFMNFKEVNKKMRELVKNKFFRYGIFAGIILFVFSYVDWLFLFLSLFVFLFVLLFIFAKALEKASMIKMVGVKDLREGDWLVDNVRVGKKVIKADWEGVSKNDLILLRKLKKKVKIKQGIAFVPAILIAFLLWWFLRGWVSNLFLGV